MASPELFYNLRLIATGALLVIALITDVRSGKIYNVVTVPFAVLGLVLATVSEGGRGLLMSLGGMAIGVGLFFVSAFFGRLLGAGDCKLFAAVGALQGPRFLVWAILFSFLAGGVLGLLVAALRRVLPESLRRAWQALYFRLVFKMPMDISQAESHARLPYAVAILVGCAFSYWWLQKQG